jgi:hypothetical protein
LGDIKNLTTKKLKELIDIDEIDLVVGGPPCQGFSTVGKGDVNDKRNALFREFVSYCKSHSPSSCYFRKCHRNGGEEECQSFKSYFSWNLKNWATIWTRESYQLKSMECLNEEEEQFLWEYKEVMIFAFPEINSWA